MSCLSNGRDGATHQSIRERNIIYASIGVVANGGDGSESPNLMY